MVKITEKKLVEEVKKIPMKAKKEKWVLTLDTDEGNFFYSPKVIPDKAELYKVTGEYSLYLDKDFKARGVMVEGYNNNFVKHHPEFKSITKKIFDKKKKEIKIVNPHKGKNEEAVTFQKLFERTLIAEACGAKLHDEEK